MLQQPLLAMLLLAATVPASVAANTQWRASGNEARVDTSRSSLRVRCDADPYPILTIAYVAPDGVRLAEQPFGVMAWNAAIGSIGADGGEVGGLYLLDETLDGNRATYSIAADDSHRDEQFGLPNGRLEEAMQLLELFRHAKAVEITSAEERDQETTPPLFRDELPLAGAFDAIQQAIAPGGCAAMIERAWEDLEGSY